MSVKLLLFKSLSLSLPLDILRCVAQILGRNQPGTDQPAGIRPIWLQKKKERMDFDSRTVTQLTSWTIVVLFLLSFLSFPSTGLDSTFTLSYRSSKIFIWVVVSCYFLYWVWPLYKSSIWVVVSCYSLYWVWLLLLRFTPLFRLQCFLRLNWVT